VVVSRACGGKPKVAPEGGGPDAADGPPTAEMMARC
jgi:hypothetical protein